SASLEQKAAMSIAPSRRIEEALPTFDDYHQFYGSQEPPQVQQQMPPPQAQPPIFAPNPANYQPEDPARTAAADLRADRDRARAAQQAAAARATAPIQVRGSQPSKKAAPAAHTSLCPNCHAAIPNDEMAQHLKIELLDPQWREQARIAQQRSATTNLSTVDVARNLKRLASARGDVFDGAVGGGGEEGGKRRGEVGGYDGQQQGQGQGGEMPGQSQGQGGQPADVQEQIRLLHQRFKG
ncbi:SF3a splicing factor complex subunit, partial [Teratosphaeriaceae sp. CCFEE 6253]